MLSHRYLRHHALCTTIQVHTYLNEHAGAPSSSSPLAFQTSVNAKEYHSLTVFSYRTVITSGSIHLSGVK